MKKSTICKTLMVILLPVIYFLLITGYKGTTESSSKAAIFSPAPNNWKNFENVIFNYDFNSVSSAQWIDSQISRYRGELNFTGIHNYDGLGSQPYGYFDSTLTGLQIGNVASLSSTVSSNNLGFYNERCKLSQLCYAQRVIYEVTQPPGDNNVNDGFCYRNTAGVYTTDSGRTVLHASLDNQYPTGYMLAENVYENRVFGTFIDFGHGARGTWYFKPMMRIPVNTPDDVPVVRIDVYNYNNNLGTGIPVESITLRGMNFKVGGNYGGNYIDMYKFIGPTGTDSLTIIGGSGDTVTPHQLNEGFPHWFDAEHSISHVDFKVYWLGQVEVWFDKMTVDEERANKLFDPVDNFDDKIQDELSHTSQNGFTYFADEISYSNVPCIKYVQNKIDAYNQQHGSSIKLNCAVNNYWNVRGTVQETLLNKTLLDSVHPPSYSIDKVGM